MRRDTINYLVVGTFVLTLGVILLVVLYNITGRTGPTDTYYVTYNNVEGIKYGTPVLYEGYQVGQVSVVEPVRTRSGTTFKLTLEVLKGWQMPQDSVAQVIKSGLLSSVAINIREGKSPTPLAEGSAMQGREATDLFAAVSDVATSIRPLLDNLNKQVNLVAGDIREITQGSIKPILDDQVKGLLKKLDASAEGLQKVLSPENQAHINSTLRNLEASSDNLQDLLTKVEESRKSLDQVLADADKLVGANQEDVRAIVTDLKKSLYSVSQHIDAVAHNLEGSSRNMQEFTRQIREDPGLLLRGSPPLDEVKTK